MILILITYKLQEPKKEKNNNTKEKKKEKIWLQYGYKTNWLLTTCIDRLQPRDKAAMLVVKTIKNFFAEFA